jgi:hypothetical protein
LVELASKIEIHLALSEETIAEPSACENKNCFAEMSFVVCLAMSNFGQNKKELAAHPIEEGSEQGKSICAELNHANDETYSLTVAPCEPIALVLNLSITHASSEQSLVESVAKYPLLQDNYKIVPYDKEKLCDHASLISTTQLVDMIILFLMIQMLKLDVLIALIVRKKNSKIISSINSLENEIFQKSGLLDLDYCTFHALGLYDNNNSYIVQKLYICSDLTTSFMVPRIDKKVTCIEANSTISSFSPVDHTLQV